MRIQTGQKLAQRVSAYTAHGFFALLVMFNLLVHSEHGLPLCNPRNLQLTTPLRNIFLAVVSGLTKRLLTTDGTSGISPPPSEVQANEQL